MDIRTYNMIKCAEEVAAAPAEAVAAAPAAPAAPALTPAEQRMINIKRHLQTIGNEAVGIGKDVNNQVGDLRNKILSKAPSLNNILGKLKPPVLSQRPMPNTNASGNI